MKQTETETKKKILVKNFSKNALKKPSKMIKQTETETKKKNPGEKLQ